MNKNLQKTAAYCEPMKFARAHSFHPSFCLTVLGIGLLAGCASVGPDYRQPASPAPANWYNTSSTGNAQLTNWWQQFKDPLLDDLISKALADSPDIASARAKLVEARARRGLQAAQNLPDSDVGLSAGRTTTRTDNNTSSRNSYEASIDASWEIDLFGGKRRALEAADATLAASVADLDAARVSLVAELASDYIALIVTQQRLAATQANVASREQTLQLTRWRAEAQLVSALELNQAISNLEAARAGIPSLQRTIEENKLAIAVLLGRTRADVEALLNSAGKLPAAPDQLASSIPADVVRQRPDLRAAERRLAAQTAQIGVAEAARYPSLKLTGSIGVDALTPSGLLRADTITTSVLGSLTAPLFDFGRTQRNVDIQTALRDQTLETWRKSVLQALADVEKALNAIQRTRERQESLQRAADSAREAARLALINYQAGRSDLLTLLDAQRTQLTQEDQLASGQGDALTSIIQLYKALGGGWDSNTASDNSASKP